MSDKNTNSMKTIGVFFGSKSTEHDISVITGQFVLSGLRKLGYKTVPVYITKTGEWMIDESLGKLTSFTDANKDPAKQESFKHYVLDMEESRGKLVFRKKGFAGKTLSIDIAFPTLHGPHGEDGTMQGLFELCDVPYVGCGVPASAIAMDKVCTKQICGAHNFPITQYVYFYKTDWEKNKKKCVEEITKKLHFPLFVKPVHLGSSIGITKVKNQKGDDLTHAIDVAFFYDDKVLIEEGVEQVMDLTCCIIGNYELQASVLQESVFASDLFDFNEKYLKEGGAQLGNSKSGVVIPARLDEKITKKIQDMAQGVFKALGCTGISRVDFLLNTKTHELFVAEVNPLPGTLYHHLWKASGMEFEELLETVIRLALEMHEKKKSLTYTFSSNVLTSLHSAKLAIKKGAE